MNISLSPNVRESGLRNSWSSQFACGIRNPGLWNSEYRYRNLESPLRLEFRNPTSTAKDLEFNTWNPNPRHKIQNLRLSWIPLHQVNFVVIEQNIPLADPGKGPGGGGGGGAPKVAQRAEKNFLGDCLLLMSGSGWPPPPPLYLEVWIPHCIPSYQ